MSSRGVHIDELRVRVSGLSREEARRLGETIAKKLMRLPLGSASRNIPSMKLRMTSERATSVEAVADAIAGKIRRNLT